MITLKCKQCGKEYEAQRSTKVFCSDNCRVKFNSKKHLISGSEKERETKIIQDAVKKYNLKEEWINEIEDYCGEQGILPSDLIETHKVSAKLGNIVPKIKKEEAQNKGLSSTWFDNYRKSKLGM